MSEKDKKESEESGKDFKIFRIEPILKEGWLPKDPHRGVETWRFLKSQGYFLEAFQDRRRS